MGTPTLSLLTFLRHKKTLINLDPREKSTNLLHSRHHQHGRELTGRAPHNKATKLPVRETLPTPTPEVSVSLQNQGLIATTDFSFTESLLDGSFGDLQFSPSTFQAFDAILDLPPHIPDANLEINFSPSGMNTSETRVNSTPVVDREADFVMAELDSSFSPSQRQQPPTTDLSDTRTGRPQQREARIDLPVTFGGDAGPKLLITKDASIVESVSGTLEVMRPDLSDVRTIEIDLRWIGWTASDDRSVPERMLKNQGAAGSRSQKNSPNEVVVELKLIEEERAVARHAVTPVLVRERSLLSPTSTAPNPLIKRFEIVEGASIRAKNQLLDGLGNRYGLKKSVPTKDGVFTWLCTRRGRKNEVSCAAYVKQLGDVFTEGATAHCHEPNPELNLKVPLVKQIKDVALKNLFESANALAEDLIVPVVKENPSAIIPPIENLARAANRKREHERPLHPTDLFFELKPEHLPKDFYRGERCIFRICNINNMC
ncbi:hypothetical protein DAPPUDRAFT_112140 [Daphnia pulex]|uniref:FLYWCH-type domain-containing protein n=1 Tax=Daphnia pulex TaxID=6669 RepID=E9HB84_DAPPU|nr:hypothetical protein DAPPUDRAFT_112140 [Daphnia pulex]|eukprot:EFX71052.1 hypothetical protein DAPPUDRAFT_112140 [Daphnia pulex]